MLAAIVGPYALRTVLAPRVTARASTRGWPQDLGCFTDGLPTRSEQPQALGVGVHLLGVHARVDVLVDLDDAAARVDQEAHALVHALERSDAEGIRPRVLGIGDQRERQPVL